MERRTCVVFGAGGLTGSYLLQELLRSDAYRQVTVFVRRKLSVTDDKLVQVVDDLESPAALAGKIGESDVYCCLGTTMKKAGSKKAFRKVDLELPVKIAGVARNEGVKNFAVVSSIGAKAASGNFYLKTKGKMELAMAEFGFENLVIVRPSLLVGRRKEFRLNELAARIAMNIFNLLFVGRFKKYRSIHAHTVALAMINLILNPGTKTTYESDELQAVADKWPENR